MRLVLSRIPRARFFAFSDDPAWVKRVLCPHSPDIKVIDHNQGGNSYMDMQLMSLCRHHIIANSTFSWWGAWLNGGDGQIVVAPRRWFLSARNSEDLFPASWMRV
jgi:hypothetical protein